MSDDVGVERYCVVQCLEVAACIKEQLHWLRPSTCPFIAAEALMCAVSMQDIMDRRLCTGLASYADVALRLPPGLAAGYSGAVAQILELLDYYLSKLVATNAMTIPADCPETDFTAYLSPCLGPALFRSMSSIDKAAVRVGAPSMDLIDALIPRVIVASAIAPNVDIDIDMDTRMGTGPRVRPRPDTGNADTAAESDLSMRETITVKFDSAEHRDRQVMLAERVAAYVSRVSTYLTEAFQHAMTTCVVGTSPVATLGLLSRVMPTAALAMHQERGKSSSVTVPRHLQSCLGALVASEMLAACISLTTAAADHGEEVGVRLTLLLIGKGVLPHLQSLRPDGHPLAAAFCVPGVELFTKFKRGMEILSDVFDVSTQDLYIEHYFGFRDAKGNVCPTAVAARLFESGYEPRGIKTRTAAKAILERAKILKAVQAADDVFDGLALHHRFRCVRYCRSSLSAFKMLNFLYDGALPDCGPDVLMRRLQDVVALTLVEIRKAVAAVSGTLAESPCRLHDQALRDARCYLGQLDPSCFESAYVDLNLACMFYPTVRAQHDNCLRLKDVQMEGAGLSSLVRTCFMDVDDWRDTSSVYTCCANRYAYHPALLRLLNVPTLCDCNDGKWRRVPAVVHHTGMSAAFLCALRLPTLTIHNVRDATPERRVVMAMLADVTRRVVAEVFVEVQKTDPDYGCCEHGHAVKFGALLENIIDYDSGVDVDDAFCCAVRSCDGRYNEVELTPFFPQAYDLMLKWRRARKPPVSAFPACSICRYNGSSPNYDGAVAACALCGDKICTICRGIVHPGATCV